MQARAESALATRRDPNIEGACDARSDHGIDAIIDRPIEDRASQSATTKAASTFTTAARVLESNIDTASNAQLESNIDSGIDLPIDADLRRVVEAWPALPEGMKRAMLAIVEAAK